VHAALVLAVLAGPFAVALVHCSVTLVRTGNLALADAWEGLKLHWRRGLQLPRRARRARLPLLHTLELRLAARVRHRLPRRPARHLCGRIGDLRGRRARTAAAARRARGGRTGSAEAGCNPPA